MAPEISGFFNTLPLLGKSNAVISVSGKIFVNIPVSISFFEERIESIEKLSVITKVNLSFSDLNPKNHFYRMIYLIKIDEN